MVAKKYATYKQRAIPAIRVKAARRKSNWVPIINDIRYRTPSMPKNMVVRTTGNRGRTFASGQELKFLDVANGAIVPFNTTGFIQCYNAMLQGTTASTRIGNKVVIKTFQLRGELVVPNDAPANTVRLILLWDSQPNGALPALTDVLTATDGKSFMNLANRDRFWVLKDWQMNVGPSTNLVLAAGAAPPLTKTFNWYVKVNRETVYNGNAGTIGDIRTGALLLLGCGSHTAASALYSTLDGTVRVRYTD